MKYYLMNKNKELMILQQNDDDFLFENDFILLNKVIFDLSRFKKNKTHKEIIKGINEWFSTRIVPNKL